VFPLLKRAKQRLPQSYRGYFIWVDSAKPAEADVLILRVDKFYWVHENGLLEEDKQTGLKTLEANARDADGERDVPVNNEGAG